MPLLVERKRADRVRIHYQDDGHDAGGGFHRRGSAYEVTADPDAGESAAERAKRVHPQAVIDGQVVQDSAGNPSIEATGRRAKLASGVAVFDPTPPEKPEPRAEPLGKRGRAGDGEAVAATAEPAPVGKKAT